VLGRRLRDQPAQFDAALAAGVTTLLQEDTMRAPIFMTALALASALSTLAGAQQPSSGQRISGKIKSVSAQEIVLVGANGSVTLGVTPQTRVLARKTARPDEVKPGAYLGTANQNNADGSSGTSTEVHLMNNGPNVHSAMNNSGLMMTNGHVKSVHTTAKGREIAVDYGQATARHVIIPAGTPTTRMVDVGLAALKPGETIIALTRPAPGGKMTAAFITIGVTSGK
jgi:hypothetical protein